MLRYTFNFEKFSPLLELQPSIDKVIKLDSKSKWKNLLTLIR